MLALGRQVGEETVIEVPPSSTPTRIVVGVKEIRREGQTVRLWFDAPRAVEIDREKIRAKKDRQAAQLAAEAPQQEAKR